mmetsp:Transcript_9173/g.19686  ORF Transcript_9173/g.19686 Transcript_9173/m.19686 type:complete len:122 (-) Transcript_9173:504-869(-)
MFNLDGALFRGSSGGGVCTEVNALAKDRMVGLLDSRSTFPGRCLGGVRGPSAVSAGASGKLPAAATGKTAAAAAAAEAAACAAAQTAFMTAALSGPTGDATEDSSKGGSSWCPALSTRMSS